MRFPVFLALLPLVGGCMPASGPGASAIVAGGGEAASPYRVIALDAAVAEAVSSGAATGLAGTFAEGGGAPTLTIGVGDVVVVTIYEAAAGGLFSGEAGSLGAGTKSVSLPPQPVSRAGTISVPYVGQVQAAGLTPAAVQERIAASLKDKAIEPQVIVTLSGSASTFVTVAGDVGSPGRIPLNLDGDRVLDAIATAGGARGPAYDSFVTLTRGGESATVNLARIVKDLGQNIYLRPDDQIFVTTDPQVYTAFGATARNESFRFETDRLTLAEAVGRAGGLLDNRANPRGVFVFRHEPQPMSLAAAAPPGTAGTAGTAGTPIVYSLDLKEPTSYFAAQRFLMRDNDIIYVSNAPATDLQKFLGILTGGLGTATRATSLERNITN